MFIILAVIMIAVFYFYPMIQALILSFKSGKGMNLSFVGLDNYARLFSDKTFITAVKNTFIYLIIQVPVMIVLAMFI
ncbi:sugar ABC transporter permease, partial [Paenibacillus sp. TAF58]